MSKDSAGAEALQEKVQLQAGASSCLQLTPGALGFVKVCPHIVGGSPLDLGDSGGVGAGTAESRGCGRPRTMVSVESHGETMPVDGFEAAHISFSSR